MRSRGDTVACPVPPETTGAGGADVGTGAGTGADDAGAAVVAAVADASIADIGGLLGGASGRAHRPLLGTTRATAV
ncbi:hypothetical protein GCM10027054_08140 [Isoptericola nanjingensis]